MNTIFRKVMVVDRIPKQTNTYFTGWDNDNRTIIVGSNYFNGKLFEDNEDTERYAQPDWWLEEVELSTDEEIQKFSFCYRTTIQQGEGFIRGAKFIRDNVLGERPK